MILYPMAYRFDDLLATEMSKVLKENRGTYVTDSATTLIILSIP